jgi:hypothetical protein
VNEVAKVEVQGDRGRSGLHDLKEVMLGQLLAAVCIEALVYELLKRGLVLVDEVLNSVTEVAEVKVDNETVIEEVHYVLENAVG